MLLWIRSRIMGTQCWVIFDPQFFQFLPKCIDTVPLLKYYFIPVNLIFMLHSLLFKKKSSFILFWFGFCSTSSYWKAIYPQYFCCDSSFLEKQTVLWAYASSWKYENWFNCSFSLHWSLTAPLKVVVGVCFPLKSWAPQCVSHFLNLNMLLTVLAPKSFQEKQFLSFSNCSCHHFYMYLFTCNET